MKLRHRFLLIAIGLVIFAIAAPALVLFARGYKIDLHTRKLFKTGTLVIKSEPSKAEVFLNDKNVSNATPSTIRFILPGDYNVTLRHDGYQDWTKRLNIKSEVVSWANFDREFIALFLKEPKLTNTVDIESVYKSPVNESLIFASGGNLNYMDDNGHLNKLADPQYASDLKNIAGSLGNNNIFNLVSVNRRTTLNLEQLAAAKQIETNDDYSAVLTGKHLDVYTSQNQVAFSTENVNGFELDDHDLWLHQGQNLLRIDLRHTNSDTVLQTLPALESRIIRGGDNTFLLTANTLFVINGKLDLIYGNTTHAYWSQKADQLVFGNDHEIFLYEPRSQRTTLILRSGSNISQPVINSKTGYVVFANEGKIKTIEIDGRDHRNVYTLTDSGDGFLVSEDGKTLSVYGDNKLKTYQIR